MRWTLVLLVLALLPLSVRAQQRTPIVAQEHQVPSASAEDSSPLMLAVSEKYQGGRDPNVQAASGRIVLLTHGSSFSGQVGVDVQVPGVPPDQSFSLMDQLALRGYDVWALAYQNYGRSDHHHCGLCVTTEAAARDIEATIQFIRGLWQVDHLHLIAWSWGAQAGVGARANAAGLAGSHSHQAHRVAATSPGRTERGSSAIVAPLAGSG
jgi:pimeloyl-ACP methyl ester carboxylesterase